MLYRINKWLRGQPDKAVQDEIGAHNEGELKMLLESLGFEYKILEKVPDSYAEGQAQPVDGSIATAGLYDQKIAPFRGENSVIKPAPIAPVPIKEERPKEILFNDNGVEFKVIGTKLYKKDWIVVDASDYKIASYNSTDGTFDILKRDWIEVNQKKDESK